MIICSALKITTTDNNEIIIPCIRHSDGFAILAKLGFKKSEFTHIEQGFVDNDNIFYDRKSALMKVKQIKQIPVSIIVRKEYDYDEELFSEDLY